MKKIRTSLFVVTFLALGFYSCKQEQKKMGEVVKVGKNNIEVTDNTNEAKIDVLVDGKLFTSYLYTDDLPVLKKTTLYPINAANGATITRGYPIAPKGKERTDHPHHIGAWFNYGDVNGLDFWNNSDAIPEEQSDKMGTIRHDRIIAMDGGAGKADLEVAANWLKPDGSIMLEEDTKFVFYAKNGERIIDRVVTLKALDDPIVFKDNKEGMIAIRTARGLEHPSKKPVTLSDAQGNKTDVPVLDNEGVNGHYLSSTGIEGDAVWGTRAKWVALFGTIDNKDVTVVIMDSPNNVGYPTYWHARGYGLFAANPLGQKIFSDGKEVLNFSLLPNESVTFTYRIAVFDGKIDKAQLDKAYIDFTGI